MSLDQVLLQGCEIIETNGILIVPYPIMPMLARPNRELNTKDVDYSDDDDDADEYAFEEEDNEADESDVQPHTRKRKRGSAHVKCFTTIRQVRSMWFKSLRMGNDIMLAPSPLRRKQWLPGMPT